MTFLNIKVSGIKEPGKLVDPSTGLIRLLVVSVAYGAFAMNCTSVSGLPPHLVKAWLCDQGLYGFHSVCVTVLQLILNLIVILLSSC